MVLVAGSGLPLDAIRQQIGSSIDLVIHVARGADGCRRVVDIAEIESSPAGWRAHSLIGVSPLGESGRDR
jgi:pilus assembly protein CpaF